jgi:hypothetical protein
MYRQELPLVALPVQEKIDFFRSWLSITIWASEQFVTYRYILQKTKIR